MHICLVSSLGAQTYADKFNSSPKSWRSLWNRSLYTADHALDVVDLLDYETGGHANYSSERHVFTNGIVLGNILRRAGHEVTIVNSFIGGRPAAPAWSNFDAILISTNYVFANWADALKGLVAEIRRANGDAPIIVGGYGALALYHGPERARELLKEVCSCGTDAIIVSRFGINSALSAIGLGRAVKSARLVVDGSRYRISGDDYAILEWPELLHRPHTTILTSYGCPYSCAYCSYKYFIGRLKYSPLTTVDKAIRAVTEGRRYRLRYLRIADECFNVPERRAIRISRLISGLDAGFSWCCFLRGDRVSGPVADALYCGGCNMVSIGLESGSAKMQGIMRKDLDLAKVREGIRILQSRGIVVVVSLLVGFYGENEQTISETRRFLEDARPDLVRFNIWEPSPEEENTRLGREFNFAWGPDGWVHTDMDEAEACDRAGELYDLGMPAAFLPPFSSVFDQWPELAGRGLSTLECLEQFRRYHEIASARREVPAGIERGPRGL